MLCITDHTLPRVTNQIHGAGYLLDSWQFCLPRQENSILNRIHTPETFLLLLISTLSSRLRLCLPTDFFPRGF
jgi:hypothetical protein